jgi:predicted dehydrogenase
VRSGARYGRAGQAHDPPEQLASDDDAGGDADQRVLGIGMVGYGFMGRAHSHAWRTVSRFFDLPLSPRVAAICGRDRAAVQAAAARLGWADWETDDRGSQGFRRIRATEREHPYAAAWWPDGHTIGYEHTFTHEVRDLLEAIAGGRDPAPSFADGLQVQQVLDAALRSAASSSTWTAVAA